MTPLVAEARNYEYDDRVADYLLSRPVTTDDLASVTLLEWVPNAMAIEAIWDQYDGES